LGNLNYSIRAVIFDLGGVLLRTEDPQPRMELARRYGLSREELEKLVFGSEISRQAEAGIVTPAAVWQYIQNSLQVGDDGLAAFQDAFWAGDRLDETLLSMVNGFRGSYRTVLLSNAWADMRRNVARRFGKLDAFDVQIFSAEIGLRKPGAEIFHYVLDLLGADPEEAVFIDDFIENIQAARRLGFHTILFTNPEQTRRDLCFLLGMEPA
jgi:epoxide hydrolase-like predicted phosphatase